MKTLTADTKITIKRSRPALTGDTKIRLSQIKDLAAWVEDRRYGIGEISTKTGLMKTTEGWVVPPHAARMIEGQEEKGNSHTINAGESIELHKMKAKEIKEYLAPKIKEIFSKEQLQKILYFQATKKKVIVDTGEGPKTIEVPAALLQDPKTQTLDSKEYQELSKDLKSQINYLHYFDFEKKTEKEASDSLQLMGFVNACAFKGRRPGGYTEKEQAINDVIYKKAKEVYLPKAVDYFIAKGARVTYDLSENLIYINNPITKVQVSFHEYNEQPHQNIKAADRNEWNKVENSYIFNNPEEMRKFEKLRNRIKKIITDKELLKDKEIELTIKKKGEEMEYDILYADGEWVRREFKDDQEAEKHLKHNREFGSMQILKIINCKTDKEITI